MTRHSLSPSLPQALLEGALRLRPAAACRRLAGQLRQAWQQARRREQDRDCLRQLDERGLADLGLGRDQIERLTDPALPPGSEFRR